MGQALALEYYAGCVASPDRAKLNEGMFGLTDSGTFIALGNMPPLERNIVGLSWFPLAGMDSPRGLVAYEPL
jgi:hypothetical protein